jgi:hypothetical protein
MRRLAKILLGGVFLTAPMLPPFSGVAISQSAVSNNQVVDLGADVLSTQTLNVENASGATSAITTAGGNGLTAGVETGSLDVQSTQAMHAQAYAGTTTGVTTYAAGVIATTAATGNDSQSTISGGGALTGTFGQVTDGSQVKSDNNFNGAAAQLGFVSGSSQAIANSLDFGVTGSTMKVTTSQSNSATVDAEGGGTPAPSGSTVQDTSGSASFSATAVANNINSTGVSGSSQTLRATQTTTNDLTQSGEFVNVGNGQTIQSAATATANNISASNQGGDLNVQDTQSNASFTYGNAVATGFEYGSGQATAYGVGNSVLASNFGPTTELNNNQTNSAGTDATASFTGGNTGGPSYDAVASSSAIGNAATAFACSDCGGTITINNAQMSTGGVEATSSVNITGANRSVTSIATAQGNNATFYVSKPSN